MAHWGLTDLGVKLGYLGWNAAPTPAEEGYFSVNLADDLLVSRRLHEAETVVARGLAVTEDGTCARARAHAIACRVLQEQGRLEEALTHAQVARSMTRSLLAPRNPHRRCEATQEVFRIVALVEADLLEALGRMEEAEASDRANVELYGERYEGLRGVHVRRGLWELKKENMKLAEAHLRRACQLRPGKAYKACEFGERKRAQELLIQVLERKETPEATAEVGRLREEVAKAKTLLDQLVDAALLETRAEARQAMQSRREEGILGPAQVPHAAAGGGVAPAGAVHVGRKKKNKKRGGKRAKKRGGGSKVDEQEKEEEVVVESSASPAPPEVGPGTEEEGALNAKGAPQASAAEAGAEQQEEAVVLVEEDEEDDDDCAICLLPFDEHATDVPIARLPCNHAFHSTCRDRWLTRCRALLMDFTCPICRRKVELA